jgi:hypothetical protein
VSSEELNCLYVPLGKAANTGIKRFLLLAHADKGLYSGPMPERHTKVHKLTKSTEGSAEDNVSLRRYRESEIDVFLKDFESRFAFSVVRNPYTRLLSGYLNKIKKRQKHPERAALKYNLPSFPADFNEFVDMVADQSDEKCNIHWTPQSYRLCLPFLEYDYIGWFETLAESMAAIAARIKAPLDELENDPRHQTGADTRVDELYDDRIAQKVYLRYKKDFEFLGYSEDFRQLNSQGMGAIADGVPYAPFLGAIANAMVNDRSSVRERVDQAEKYAQERGDVLIYPDRIKRFQAA